MPKGQPFSGKFEQRAVEDARKKRVSYNQVMQNMGYKGEIKSSNGNEFSDCGVNKMIVS